MHERMYDELAQWWPLLSAPQDYAQEAGIYERLLLGAARGEVRTLLELGSGGGNNASHLKRRFEVTLVDRSSEMLTVSRALNPECRHEVGDMRTLRLDETFDAVLVHDAISYMTTTHDLAAAIGTAHAHCRPGGVALFVPDDIEDCFAPSTSHGGHDGDSTGVRYLEWTQAPPAGSSTCVSDYVIVVRTDDEVRVVHDRHTFGLFSMEHWLDLLVEAGFDAQYSPQDLDDDVIAHCFLGVRV